MYGVWRVSKKGERQERAWGKEQLLSKAMAKGAKKEAL